MDRIKNTIWMSRVHLFKLVCIKLFNKIFPHLWKNSVQVSFSGCRHRFFCLLLLRVSVLSSLKGLILSFSFSSLAILFSVSLSLLDCNLLLLRLIYNILRVQVFIVHLWLVKVGVGRHLKIKNCFYIYLSKTSKFINLVRYLNLKF